MSTAIANIRTKAADAWATHKKSCISVVALVVIIIIVIFIWAHNYSPDGFTTKWLPAWASPDLKLLNKNHTGETRRSDNKVDDWSSKDFIESVAKFNHAASTT